VPLPKSAAGLAKYVVTLQRSSVEPFLQFSSRRDLREKGVPGFPRPWRQGDATDNKAIIAETIKLRIERAKLLVTGPSAVPARRRDGENAGGGASASRKGLEAGARTRAGRP